MKPSSSPGCRPEVPSRSRTPFDTTLHTGRGRPPRFNCKHRFFRYYCICRLRESTLTVVAEPGFQRFKSTTPSAGSRQ
ncbi:hypothetical protein MRB53_039120 [Persea americana]|nr:hypothetical protein MRB53_039120 [Persea americana]